MDIYVEKKKGKSETRNAREVENSEGQWLC